MGLGLFVRSHGGGASVERDMAIPLGWAPPLHRALARQQVPEPYPARALGAQRATGTHLAIGGEQTQEEPWVASRPHVRGA